MGPRFPLDPGLGLVFREVGAPVGELLARAGLPADALGGTLVDARTYFALWRALEEVTKDPQLPLTVALRYPVEVFQPALFAALASPHLGAALERLSDHKQLLGPLRFSLRWTGRQLTLTLRYVSDAGMPPEGLVLTEMAFLVRLARLGTRESIRPESVSLRRTRPNGPIPRALRDHFGVEVEAGRAHQITFSRSDAERPFLTRNDAMWSVFAPELRRRVAELEGSESWESRVHGALLELIPAGRASLKHVAEKLGVTERTLQRRILAEQTSFAAMRDRTRMALARHYLNETEVSLTEIAFLLAFDNPNSFHRAFRRWTGQTPGAMREEAAG